MSKRRISEEEESLWRKSTLDVKKLENDTIVTSQGRHTVSRRKIQQRQITELYQSITSQNQTTSAVTSKSSRTRKVVIEGRVDLHGLTQNQAQEKLKQFLIQAQLAHKEWVLVITGKGSVTHKSVLRQVVPQWLDQWSLVTTYMMAKPKDGGSGALYVRIRRQNLFHEN
jgi:DNA-nicking Smr family endonuclease